MTTSVEPPLIGPHEGRELSLMLAGEKPLALFYALLSERHVIPEAVFAPHVRDGAIVKVERTVAGREAIILVVLDARPDEAWRIEAALQVIEPVWTGARPPSPDDDIEIGRLLGYPEGAIARFVGARARPTPRPSASARRPPRRPASRRCGSPACRGRPRG